MDLVCELLHECFRHSFGEDVGHHRFGVLVDTGAESFTNGLENPRSDGSVAACDANSVGRGVGLTS